MNWLLSIDQRYNSESKSQPPPPFVFRCHQLLSIDQRYNSESKSQQSVENGDLIKSCYQ